MRLLLLVCGLAIATRTVGATTIVTLVPARDNTLFESAAGALVNGAGPALFAGKTGQGLARRALLFFDVASHIPPGAQIDSVVLRLRVSNAPNDILRQVTVHRVLTDWGEGTSVAAGGVGSAAEEGDATWIHTFYPFQRWSSEGGDFDPTPSAALLVGGTGSYEWDGAALRADVQS